MNEILVLYYSRHGSVAQMARAMAHGVESVSGMTARLRTVPPVSADAGERAPAIPDEGPPYAVLDDLRECSGLLLGSPTRFGNMAAPLKHFLDGTSALWLSGVLAGKPAAVFTSTGTLHGGQESTILSTHTVLLHHGMVVVGLPYSCDAQMGVDQIKGGSPYGASTISDNDGSRQPSAQELQMARFQGRHVATLAARLGADRT